VAERVADTLARVFGAHGRAPDFRIHSLGELTHELLEGDEPIATLDCTRETAERIAAALRRSSRA
jgi:hypothetical protein